MRTEVVYPHRWSWVEWWEANREEFLSPQPVTLGQMSEEGSGPPNDQRAKAVKALLQELSSKAWQGRSEAALALGRMGEASAVDKLQQMAARDPNASVRQAAAAGLALIGGPQAENALLVLSRQSAGRGNAALSALAATTQPSDVAKAELERIVRGNDPRAAIAAGRALGQNGKTVRADLFREILAKTANPWLAIEAILGLGESADPADIPLLTSILLGADSAANTVLSWRQIQISRAARLDDAGRFAGAARQQYNQDLAKYKAERAAWMKETGKRLPRGSTRPDWMIVPVGQEEVFLGHFRAAAAVALGRMDRPDAMQALGQSLLQKGDEWGGLSQDPNALARMIEFSDLHKGMAIMSLGRSGAAGSVPLLVEMLEGRIPNAANYSPERLKDSPLRGYAALALGIYARPVKDGNKASDRPQSEAACDAVTRRLLDPMETSEVRVAAALALGVSGRPEYLPALLKIDVTKEKDMALAGYVLLARAMLKDPEVAKLAKLLLSRKPIDSVSDTLGRRAAVLALGMQGTPEVVLTLKWAWNQPYDVNRETGRALALAKAYDVTDELVQMLKPQNQPWLEAFAAKCLGQLFTQEEADPLSKLVRDSAYSLRDDDARPLQNMANDFLGRIIPGIDVVSKQP